MVTVGIKLAPREPGVTRTTFPLPLCLCPRSTDQFSTHLRQFLIHFVLHWNRTSRTLNHMQGKYRLIKYTFSNILKSKTTTKLIKPSSYMSVTIYMWLSGGFTGQVESRERLSPCPAHVLAPAPSPARVTCARQACLCCS